MGATTTYGWPTPDLSDPANGPAGILSGLQAAENTVKDATLTSYTPAWTSTGAVQPTGGVTKIGRYRVDHGRCTICINLIAGTSPSGGTGNLYLGLPIAPRSDIPEQILPAYYWSPTSGAGVYQGLGRLLAGLTAMPLYFPVGRAEVDLAQWRNAADGNAAGTGVPLVPGDYGWYPPAQVTVSGSYFV